MPVRSKTATQRKAQPVRAAAQQRSRRIVLPLVRFGTNRERSAGWLVVMEAMQGGWRSVGPYGPRGDLYDRP
jgi:hypothetical protein